MKSGLTKAQRATLKDLLYWPKTHPLGYRPAQTLVKLGLAEWCEIPAWRGKRGLQITDAGRAALESAKT